MTLRFRFSNSDMITTAGVAIRPIEINDIGGTFERIGQPEITESFSHQELAEMMRRPDTTYFAGYFDRATQEMRLNKSVEVISELPEQIGGLAAGRRRRHRNRSVPEAVCRSRHIPERGTRAKLPWCSLGKADA